MGTAEVNVGNAAIPILSRYGSVAIQLVVISVVARDLDSKGTAQYFSVMGWVLATYFWVGAGLPDGAVKEVPALKVLERTSDSTLLLKRAFRRSLLSLPVGFFASVVAGYAVCANVQAALATGLWWAAYAATFASSQTVVAAGKPRAGTAMFYSAANLGQVCFTVPALIIASPSEASEVLLLAGIGTGISACVCILVTTTLIDRIGGQAPVPVSAPSDRLIRQAARAGWPIAAGRFVQAAIIWSPVWVASVALSSERAADMGLASRLVSAVAGVIAAVRFSIRPQLSEWAALGDWHAIESKGRSIATAATGLAVAALCGTLTLGWTVVPALFGHQREAAVLLTAMLLFGTIGESIGGPVDEVLKMSGAAIFVLAAQAVLVMVSALGQYAAATMVGSTALAMVYSMGFIALYIVLIIRLNMVRGILLIPGGRRNGK